MVFIALLCDTETGKHNISEHSHIVFVAYIQQSEWCCVIRSHNISEHSHIVFAAYIQQSEWCCVIRSWRMGQLIRRVETNTNQTVASLN